MNNCSVCTVSLSQTFLDLIPNVFTNNGDDSISMPGGASRLEDYFLNLLIHYQLAVFQTVDYIHLCMYGSQLFVKGLDSRAVGEK